MVKGVRDIEGFLEQWQIDTGDLRRRMILAPTPREREPVVRHAGVGPGVDGLGDGRGIGTGSPYHRTVGCRLERGRSSSLDIRADWGFPPALGEAQQKALRAAVQGLPAKSGIELANWTLRQAQEEGGTAVCRGTVWHQPEPQ